MIMMTEERKVTAMIADSSKRMTAVIVDSNRGIKKMVATLIRNSHVNGGRKNIIGFYVEWYSMTINDQQAWISYLIFSNGDIAYVLLLERYSCRRRRLAKPLLSFLGHPDFTFVGMGMEENIAKLGQFYQASCRNAVDLVRLAAELLENPRLRGCCRIDQLADGILLPQTPRPSSVVFEEQHGFNRNDDVFQKYYWFCEEEVSQAIANTCAYHWIGKTLLFEG